MQTPPQKSAGPEEQGKGGGLEEGVEILAELEENPDPSCHKKTLYQ